VSTQVTDRIIRAFGLTYDFYSLISDDGLSLRIPHAPSNTIGEQAWCIIGGRESYLKALKAGAWQGFSCGLEDCLAKHKILVKLNETALALTELQINSRHTLDTDFLLQLLEHEVQHHGQLIRYAYANRLGFPESWIKRYTV